MMTSMDRKGTLAVCRALRAQILRFETAFCQLHGRPPRGASEKAPLAKTYDQYKGWKRAIRADAARRIQARVRGALTRRRILEQQQPCSQLSRIVARNRNRCAGRRLYARSDCTCAARDDSARGPLAWDGEDIRTTAEPEIGDRSRDVDYHVVDPRATTPIASSSSSHCAGSTTIRRRWSEDSEDNDEEIEIETRLSADQNDWESFPSPRWETDSDLARLSLAELKAQKRALKKDLQQYDANFREQHGRMPVKAEKEPIRHLYNRYNALKGHIGDKLVLSSSN